jgi:hypothetical protein
MKHTESEVDYIFLLIWLLPVVGWIISRKVKNTSITDLARGTAPVRIPEWYILPGSLLLLRC